jgi:hypothetical protein
MFMEADEISLMIRLTVPLKQKLQAIARSERRTLENQAVCLIENALRVFESEDRDGGAL